MASFTVSRSALADGDLRKLQHIVIVMQKNHSFDSYFGALAYAPGSPFHSPQKSRALKGCAADDHLCVDGLSCVSSGGSGRLTCSNSNPDENGNSVFAFHAPTRCVVPDVNHGWVGSHEEANFAHPSAPICRPTKDDEASNDELSGLHAALCRSPNDGFVRVNDATEQIDNGAGALSGDPTMNFYDQTDIPFYYGLAQSFAIDDRYFSSLLSSSFSNRSYLIAATSFGHLTTNDAFPPPGGVYQPIAGTIFDLLDLHGVTWANYFQDVPQGGSFRPFSATAIDPHFLPLPVFLAQAAGAPGAGDLPQVSFIDPNFGVFDPTQESDEHPPTDMQRGQAFVSQVIHAVRSGPSWKDTIVFLTYDEGGGFYDHVAPPRAQQGGARTPDGVFPGQCADLSNPPASLLPGGGAQCSANLFSPTNTSVANAIGLCPELSSNAQGAFPADCAAFDQLGFRVPFVAVSPFSKAHYVSHTVGDHTSLLALIEKRFLSEDCFGDGGPKHRAHLTARDAHASPLLDLFDFDGSPSFGTPVPMAAAPPANDCSTLPTGSTTNLD